MSAFKPVAAPGTGLTPEQLANLVSDGDLSASQAAALAAIVASIPTPASPGALETAKAAIIAAIPAPATPAAVAAVQAAVDALVVPATPADVAAVAAAIAALPAPALPADVAAVKADTDTLKTGQTAISAAIADLAAAGGGEVYPGEVRLFRAAAVAGWTRLESFPSKNPLFVQGRFHQTFYDYAFMGSQPVSSLTAANPPGVCDDGTVVFVFGSGSTRTFNISTETYSAALATFPLTSIQSFAFALGLPGTRQAQFFSPFTTGFHSYRYDADTDYWSRRADLPAIRQSPCGAYDATTGKAYLFGGYSVTTGNTDATMRQDLDVYDPVADSYTTRAGLPVKMTNGHAVPLGGGKIWVFPGGGTATPGGYTGRRSWVYDCVADTWTECDSLGGEVQQQPLYGGIAVPAPGGRVVYIPPQAPSAGARGRLLTPTAAAGAQWEDFAIASNSSSSAAGGTGFNFAASASLRGIANALLPNGLVLAAVRQASSGTDLLGFINLNIDGGAPTAPQAYFVKD